MKKIGSAILLVMLLLSQVALCEGNPGVQVQDFCSTILYRYLVDSGAQIDRNAIFSSDVITDGKEEITLKWGAYTITAFKAGNAVIKKVSISMPDGSIGSNDTGFDSYDGKKGYDVFVIRAASMIAALEYEPLSQNAADESVSKDHLEKANALYESMLHVLESEYENINGEIDIECYDGNQYRYFWHCSRPMYIPLITDTYEISLCAEQK